MVKKIASNSGYSFNLEKMVLPELQDTKSYNATYYNPSIDNLWFNHLLDFYNKSSLHASIINNLHRRLQKGYENDPVWYRISLDYILMGSYSLEILWNLEHKNIVQMNHLSVSNVRIGLRDENGNNSFFYYSCDWGKYNNRDIDVLRAYSTDVNSDDHQCYYQKRYEPSNNVYSKPYYFSGLKEIATSVGLSDFYSNLVKNNMVANTIISVNQVMDENQAILFEKMIRKNFTDTKNAGSIVVLYNEDKDHAPEIVKFNGEEDDLKYAYINDKVVEQIAMAHNLPSALLGLLVPGKLGNSTDIPIFDAIYEQYTVDPIRQELKKSYDPLQNLLINKNNVVEDG